MECIEIQLLKCPKCKRVLKPSVEDKTIVNKVVSHTLLVCRYCKLSVKSSLLRKQKDPVKFLKQFAKAPEDTEISEEEKEKIRLREEHKENIEKYKHYPVPKKCPYCKSEDLVADSYNYGWICLSCDDGFEWESYRISFHGDVEVDATNPDDAIERGYNLLGDNCKVDIDAEMDMISRR